MKIYDCFTYFDEDLILDTRLNIMDDHVDYYISFLAPCKGLLSKEFIKTCLWLWSPANRIKY